MTEEEKYQENETSNKQRRDKYAADKTENKRFSFRKCSYGFKVKRHSQNCACKQCPYCRKWNRDMNVHIRHEHPEHHVTEKLDLYKVMRMQCLRGIIDFQKHMENASKRDPSLKKFEVSYKENRGMTISEQLCNDVRVTAEILRKDVSDPLIEGLDTWGVKELFGKQGQQCRKADPKTGQFQEVYIDGTETNVPYHQKNMMQLRDKVY